MARRTVGLPLHPTRRGDEAARRRRVRSGRSAGACVPRASARMGVARGGRWLLRGHVLACGPTAAVLRMRALAYGPSAARLRAVALAYSPTAAAARLPPAAPLGPRAAPVCLRRRARPACSGRLPPAPRSASPLRRPRPVEIRTSRALRPASLPPDGFTPCAPASAAQASPSSFGAWGGGAGLPNLRQAAASHLHAPVAKRRHPSRRRAGRACAPARPESPAAQGSRTHARALRRAATPPWP